VTRADLAAAVYDRTIVSHKEALELVEMTIGEIADMLGRGEDVKLVSFGAFLACSKRERIGRNPKTGVEATIAARRVVMFKPSQDSQIRWPLKKRDAGFQLNMSADTDPPLRSRRAIRLRLLCPASASA